MAPLSRNLPDLPIKQEGVGLSKMMWSTPVRAPIQPPQRAKVWLTARNQVHAHLQAAAAEVGAVTVTQLLESAEGLLAFPRLDEGTVDVVFDRPPMMISSAGSAVEICYHQESSRFSFHTTVRAVVDPRRWRVAIPKGMSVERSRGAERVPAPARSTIRLEPRPGEPQTLKLHDLSETGVAFVYPEGALELVNEQPLVGTMTLQGQPAPVLLEVRHTRTLRGQERLAGCLIRGMSPTGRERLWAALTAQGLRR